MLALYLLTLSVTAALLFLVEPLVAKALLPTLGGGPVVWTTCAAFFQVALLFGYTYAHVALRRLPVAGQALVHLPLLGLAWLTLPLGDTGGWAAPSEHQGLWLFGRLALLVGLPFVLLSASAPLLQRWLASSGHQRGGDPYFLYAASNLGSLLALLSYPLLVEPALGLARQRHLWSWGFGAAVVLFVACAAAVVRARSAASPAADAERAAAVPLTGEASSSSPASWGQRLRWLVLAMVPASLLLSVTSYASTDLAALPLLWVIPLALYLLTFVVAFQQRPARVLSPARVLRLQAFFLIPLAIEFLWKIQGAAWPLIPFHFLAFTLCALVCHQALAASRPPVSQLTSFYFWVALGGALGGLFNVLAAPLLFATVMEYPLGIVAAALLRPPGMNPPPARRRRDVLVAVGFFAGLCAVVGLIDLLRARLGTIGFLLIVGPTLCAAGVIALAARDRPLRFGLVIAALVGASVVHEQLGDRPLFAGRSFFAVHVVRDDGQRRVLSQGNTTHGFQDQRPERRQQPTSYYHRATPVGRILDGWRGTPQRRRVAVVGLGTGTLAAYADRGEQWTFYEIDPLVIAIARDPRLFTFLAETRGAVDIVRGDARLSLGAAADQSFGVIVVDAFTSDAIPAHLLTIEALRLYAAKLGEGGLMVFHISNRYLDLRGVVARAAEALGFAVGSCDGAASADERRDGKLTSQYMIVAPQRATMARVPADAGCEAYDPASSPLAQPWTDDRWSLWPVLRLRWSETFDLRRLEGQSP